MITANILIVKDFDFCDICDCRIPDGDRFVQIFVEQKPRSAKLIAQYYCKDCALKLYQELKPVLNSKLWIFE
jgi:hypothetical protein